MSISRNNNKELVRSKTCKNFVRKDVYRRGSKKIHDESILRINCEERKKRVCCAGERIVIT